MRRRHWAHCPPLAVWPPSCDILNGTFESGQTDEQLFVLLDPANCSLPHRAQRRSIFRIDTVAGAYHFGDGAPATLASIHWREYAMTAVREETRHGASTPWEGVTVGGINAGTGNRRRSATHRVHPLQFSEQTGRDVCGPGRCPLADASLPARASDTDGAAAPSGPLTKANAEILPAIGDWPATVLFAGVTPGQNAIVPDGMRSVRERRGHCGSIQRAGGGGNAALT